MAQMNQKCYIDNIQYCILEECTIYQICFSISKILPCFCYHEKLTIAGNCRICLVEANTTLALACSTPALRGMRIFTNTKRVKYARESVLEFLLINHPLDCPICDQGGECDLQDISLAFGQDKGRYNENFKRSVDNLNCLGPLIKTNMVRCIHCTRCVRFLSEVAGILDLGILGRGELMEIGTFLEILLNDALSGNIIDLCPVGALTSMPYAFTARAWELNSIESIDVLDSLASSIRVEVVNNTIKRILPLLNEQINEEWITNNARFYYDSLLYQRLNYPKFLFKFLLVKISWSVAFKFIYSYIYSNNYNLWQICLNPFLNFEEIFVIKEFFTSFGCNNFKFGVENLKLLIDFRGFFVFTQSLQSLEFTNIFLLIGTNLRLEFPLLNSRIRKCYLNNKSVIYSIGMASNFFNYTVVNLGCSIHSLIKIWDGRSKFFKLLVGSKYIWNCNFICNNFICISKRVTVFVGFSVFRNGVNNIWNLFCKSFHYFKFWKLNILSDYLGRVSMYEFILPGNVALNENDHNNFFYTFCEDGFFYNVKSKFRVYQGYFDNCLNANLLLPVSFPLEQDGMYMNLEGRFRWAKLAVRSFKFVYTNWEIFAVLNWSRNRYENLDNFSVFENFCGIISLFSYLIQYKCVFFFSLKFIKLELEKILSKNETGNVFEQSYNFLNIGRNFNNIIFSRTITNYYIIKSIIPSSKILSLCAWNSWLKW